MRKGSKWGSTRVLKHWTSGFSKRSKLFSKFVSLSSTMMRLVSNLYLFRILHTGIRETPPPNFLSVSSDNIQRHKDIQCIIHPPSYILLIKLENKISQKKSQVSFQTIISKKKAKYMWINKTSSKETAELLCIVVYSAIISSATWKSSNIQFKAYDKIKFHENRKKRS